ncbi:MAG: AAA family ATPase [Omnitrophica bacterium]|nr:AAA family ATPase [Candidatus Omnitrophota bacterium]
MKIAFTGKGGVGKTTLAGLFIQALAKGEKEVLAVDCDPSINLGRALGLESARKITPIAEMEKLINERMGVSEGNKTFFKLNPKLDDIPDKFAVKSGNIKLIVMGAVEKGGSGCMCPENTFVKNLLSHLILKRGEHLVMDMVAGIEHLGRGTAESCDFVLIVVEPTLDAIGVAKKIRIFARDIGVKKIYAIGNKVRGAEDIEFIKKNIDDITLLDTIDFDECFLKKDKKDGTFEVSKKVNESIQRIKKILEEDTD